MNRLAANSSKASAAAFRPSRAFTLLEMVTALVITTIIITAITSTTLLASKAMPSEQDADRQTVDAARLLEQIAAELRMARHVTERSATVLGFTVADRDGDGNPERIRYAWSGTPGDPLTRQYNGGAVVTVLSAVQELNFGYDVQTVSQTYPGYVVESPTEIELAGLGVTQHTHGYDITPSSWLGQYFEPVLSGAVTGWRVTRVKYRAMRTSGSSAMIAVQLRTADAGFKPTSTVLAQATKDATTFTSSYQWYEASFANMTPVRAGQGLCLVIKYFSGSSTTNLHYEEHYGPGRLKTSDGGASWTYDPGRSLYYYVYGKLRAPGPDQTATRQYLTGVHLSLRGGAASRPPLEGFVQTLNVPELLSGCWEAAFDGDPTSLDLNGDGVNDWQVSSGGTFNVNKLSNGVWAADKVLQIAPANNIRQPTTVDLRMRDTVAGDGGAAFWIDADWSSYWRTTILANVKLESDGTQTLALSQYDNVTATTLTQVSGLSADFHDVRIFVDPTLDTVNLKVDDVDRGTFAYTRYYDNDSPLTAVYPLGNGAEFDEVRIRVAESN